MSQLKRNDKVYVLDTYLSTPKMTLTIEIPPGKMLIIKKIFEPDYLTDSYWVICDGSRHEGGERWLPVNIEKLFKYTRIGELLYG